MSACDLPAEEFGETDPVRAHVVSDGLGLALGAVDTSTSSNAMTSRANAFVLSWGTAQSGSLHPSIPEAIRGTVASRCRNEGGQITSEQSNKIATPREILRNLQFATHRID